MKKDGVLELSLFIKESVIEFNFNILTKELIIFILFENLQDFVNILGYPYFDETRISCQLKYGYIAFDFNEVLESCNSLYSNETFINIIMNKLDNNQKIEFKNYIEEIN